MVLQQLLALVERELPGARQLRRELHRRPELGCEEHQTSAMVAAELPERPVAVAGTGLMLRIGPEMPYGIAVRAELDGLAIREKTGAAFAAVNGLMHACGHDVHLAALVALARAAHAMGAALPAPLLCLFQPSEERHPSGALAVLADPTALRRIRAIIAAHLHPDFVRGALGCAEGAVNAAADAVHVIVHGAGSHAGYPHRGSDPVLAMAQVVVALHNLVGRRVDPTHPATLSVGMLSAGTTENVIPPRAEARVTFRSLDSADQDTLRAAVRATIRHIAAAHGCRAEIKFTKSEPPLVNDSKLAAACAAIAPDAGFRLAPPWQSCGGDDFAHYGSLMPTMMAFVGLAGAPGFSPHPLHHPAFLPPDEAVDAVARAQALCFVAAATAAYSAPPAF